jgi:hypothetical protein
MKKLLATAILGLISLTAMANEFAVQGGRATVEYSNVDGVNGAKNGTGYMINYNTPITKTLDGGFQMTTTQTDGTNAVSTRVEANLTPKYDLGKVTVYAKGTYGTKLSTAGTTDYYAVEPGVIVPLNDKFSVRAGYRFRSAFDDKVADTTRTERLGVTYALTKKDAFTVRYDRQRGDSQQNSWNFAYTSGF